MSFLAAPRLRYVFPSSLIADVAHLNRSELRGYAEQKQEAISEGEDTRLARATDSRLSLLEGC